jgi:hypothetical protein
MMKEGLEVSQASTRIPRYTDRVPWNAQITLCEDMTPILGGHS